MGGTLCVSVAVCDWEGEPESVKGDGVCEGEREREGDTEGVPDKDFV